MRVLHVAPISDERWVVTLDDDAEPPISEHTTRGEAETSARTYAETFGYPEIDIHHANGDMSRILLTEEIDLRRPGHPGPVNGPFAAE
jgi:hypothetical protein